jgi:hypothetical protein
MLKTHGADMVRIRRMIDDLPAELAAALSPALESPWKARSRRLGARDCAICVAVASFYPGRRHAAAVALERDIGRAHAGMLSAFTEPQRAALAQIIDLNLGRRIAWRQIENILVGSRTPDFAIISARNCKK